MQCKSCKANMKKMGQNNRWIQEHFYWCPECGMFLCEEHNIKHPADHIWYKPGYLIEQEGS